MRRANKLAEFSNEIRRQRKKLHFRLKDVAILLGHRDVSQLSHWEKGRKTPGIVNLYKLAAILRCPPEVLHFKLFREISHEIFERKKRFNIWERYGWEEDSPNQDKPITH
jgi:transcriptional regulator with XRE-family HTH domain